MDVATTGNPPVRLCPMCAQPDHGSLACAAVNYVQVDWSTWKSMTATPPSAPGTRGGYGSNRGDFVDIAGNPVPTSDPRPRCATCGGQRFIPDRLAPDRNVVPCPDCQPAPTPSGDDARSVEEAWAKYQTIIGIARFRGDRMPHPDGTLHALAEADRARGIVEAAIRAESAAALQEASERAELAERNQDTLARALQTTVDAHEAAEARLREVEDALREVRDQLWGHLGGRSARAKAINAAFSAAHEILSPLAASRPVPAALCVVHVPDQGRCLHDADDHMPGWCSMCGDEHAFTPAPAATPSTDEEGRA